MTIIPSEKCLSLPGLPTAPGYFGQVVSVLPAHRTYVELYESGPTLLQAKERSKVEVVNDPVEVIRNSMAALRLQMTTDDIVAIDAGKHPIQRFHNVQIEFKPVADLITVYDTPETLFVAPLENFNDPALITMAETIQGNILLFSLHTTAVPVWLEHWTMNDLPLASGCDPTVHIWQRR